MLAKVSHRVDAGLVGLPASPDSFFFSPRLLSFQLRTKRDAPRNPRSPADTFTEAEHLSFCLVGVKAQALMTVVKDEARPLYQVGFWVRKPQA